MSKLDEKLDSIASQVAKLKLNQALSDFEAVLYTVLGGKE